MTIDIKELKKLAEAATPVRHDGEAIVIGKYSNGVCRQVGTSTARYIASACNDLPELIAKVEELESKYGALTDILGSNNCYTGDAQTDVLNLIARVTELEAHNENLRKHAGTTKLRLAEKVDELEERNKNQFDKILGLDKKITDLEAVIDEQCNPRNLAGERMFPDARWPK